VYVCVNMSVSVCMLGRSAGTLLCCMAQHQQELALRVRNCSRNASVMASESFTGQVAQVVLGPRVPVPIKFLWSSVDAMAGELTSLGPINESEVVVFHYRQLSESEPTGLASLVAVLPESKRKAFAKVVKSKYSLYDWVARVYGTVATSGTDRAGAVTWHHGRATRAPMAVQTPSLPKFCTDLQQSVRFFRYHLLWHVRWPGHTAANLVGQETPAPGVDLSVSACAHIISRLLCFLQSKAAVTSLVDSVATAHRHGGLLEVVLSCLNLHFQTLAPHLSAADKCGISSPFLLSGSGADPEKARTTLINWGIYTLRLHGLQIQLGIGCHHMLLPSFSLFLFFSLTHIL
jgi:hypothetical protein